MAQVAFTHSVAHEQQSQRLGKAAIAEGSRCRPRLTYWLKVEVCSEHIREQHIRDYMEIK